MLGAVDLRHPAHLVEQPLPECLDVAVRAPIRCVGEVVTRPPDERRQARQHDQAPRLDMDADQGQIGQRDTEAVQGRLCGEERGPNTMVRRGRTPCSPA